MIPLPKTFLCRWSLRTGAIFVGIVMLVTTFAVAICTLVQAMAMSHLSWSDDFCSRNAYGYSITANLYAVIMLLLHTIFICAVVQNRAPSVILSWAVLTMVWLALTFVLFVVLIILYAQAVSYIGWVICLAFGLFGFCILLYGLAVGFAFWLELHDKAFIATS